MSADGWYLHTADGQAGPYRTDDIRSFLSKGQISAEWYAWREGMPEWTPIATIPDFLSAPPSSESSRAVGPQPIKGTTAQTPKANEHDNDASNRQSLSANAMTCPLCRSRIGFGAIITMTSLDNVVCPACGGLLKVGGHRRLVEAWTALVVIVGLALCFVLVRANNYEIPPKPMIFIAGGSLVLLEIVFVVPAFYFSVVRFEPRGMK